MIALSISTFRIFPTLCNRRILQKIIYNLVLLNIDLFYFFGDFDTPYYGFGGVIYKITIASKTMRS